MGDILLFARNMLLLFRGVLDYIAKAAAGGSARALGGLAAMYADGRGVPKDDSKSLDYAEKATKAGNPFGLRVIADHYFNGAGIPREYRMCAQYLQHAADLGDGQSMKFLANMYESGYLGCPDAANTPSYVQSCWRLEEQPGRRTAICGLSLQSRLAGGPRRHTMLSKQYARLYPRPALLWPFECFPAKWTFSAFFAVKWIG